MIEVPSMQQHSLQVLDTRHTESTFKKKRTTSPQTTAATSTATSTSYSLKKFFRNTELYEDILTYVFEFVFEPGTLFNCTQVCHLWRNTLQNINLWRRKIAIAFPPQEIPFAENNNQQLLQLLASSSTSSTTRQLQIEFQVRKKALLSRMNRMLREWYDDWTCYWSSMKIVEEPLDDTKGQELVNIDPQVYVFERPFRMFQAGFANNSKLYEQLITSPYHYQETSFNHLLMEQLQIQEQFANKYGLAVTNGPSDQQLSIMDVLDVDEDLEFAFSNEDVEPKSPTKLVLQDSEDFAWYRQAKEEQEKKILKRKEKAAASSPLSMQVSAQLSPTLVSHHKQMHHFHMQGSHPIDNYKKFVPKQFKPELYWPHFEDIIRKKFSRHFLEVSSIENVAQPDLSERFSSFWSEEEGGVPVLCFHGTPSQNLGSIIQQGLVIPGRGNNIQVAHGSVYGLGIYLSLDPSISVSYCEGSNKMFVCALLVGKHFYTTRAGSIIVAFKQEQVLPCWVVTFKNTKPQQLYYTPSSSSSRKQKTKLVQNGSSSGDNHSNGTLSAIDAERELLERLNELRGLYVDMYHFDTLISSSVVHNKTQSEMQRRQDFNFVDSNTLCWKDVTVSSALSCNPLTPCIFKWKNSGSQEELSVESFAKLVGLHANLWKTPGSVKWYSVVTDNEEAPRSSSTFSIDALLPTQPLHREFISRHLKNVKFILTGLNQMNPCPVFIIGETKNSGYLAGFVTSSFRSGSEEEANDVGSSVYDVF